MAKSKLAKYRSKRKNSAPSDAVANEAKAVATSVAAGFAGYAATRLISRIAYSQAVKKWPKASKHVHFAASALTGVGVFFGSKYSKKAREYQEEIIIGSGIAVLQSAIQTYLPKFGWIVSDVDPSQYGAAKKKTKELPAANMTSILPAEASQPEIGTGFDLDTFLAENSEVEAVPIGQAPPTEMPAEEIDDGIDDDIFGAMGDDSDLENFNGFIN